MTGQDELQQVYLIDSLPLPLLFVIITEFSLKSKFLRLLYSEPHWMDPQSSNSNFKYYFVESRNCICPLVDVHSHSSQLKVKQTGVFALTASKLAKSCNLHSNVQLNHFGHLFYIFLDILTNVCLKKSEIRWSSSLNNRSLSQKSELEFINAI